MVYIKKRHDCHMIRKVSGLGLFSKQSNRRHSSPGTTQERTGARYNNPYWLIGILADRNFDFLG